MHDSAYSENPAYRLTRTKNEFSVVRFGKSHSAPCSFKMCSSSEDAKTFIASVSKWRLMPSKSDLFLVIAVSTLGIYTKR